MIPKHVMNYVEEIKKTGIKLSKTEAGLITSVSERAKQSRLITEYQARFLIDIYARVTGGGKYQKSEYIG